MNAARLTVAYVRVSTEDQSVENQLPDLRQLAEARGLTIARVFSENMSAVKHRPEYEALLKAAHSGKVGTILIWALDRLHRSMVGSMQTVLELDRLGVRVISVREPWLDTSGPVRSLLIAVFGWVAEQERRRISERTKAGLDRARRAGKKLGKPGFDIDVVRAQALREAGTSYRRIAAELGVSVGKVHETLVGRRSVRQTPLKTPTEEAQNLGVS
jgi:DNA invertase Pin-like site-specific DNA recombinase